MNILKTQQLLERLACLLRTETRQLLSQHGLQPIQLEVLHYLSLCNRYSDSPMGVTEYLGQTKGSVSQTLKVLEKKGFINKTADRSDKRVTHMSLTEEGSQLLQSLLPSPLLEAASRQLSDEAVGSIERSLHTLLKSVQHANNFKSFGQCASCRHNIQRSADEHLCGLTTEALSTKDIELICREHEPSHSSKRDAAV